jgi:hypothetical protein
MAKFRAQVCYTSYVTYEIEVEADSEKEAKVKALKANTDKGRVVKEDVLDHPDVIAIEQCERATHSRRPLMDDVGLIYDYRGFDGCDSHCGLQIYRGTDGTPVVIFTQLSTNEGTCVTKMIEYLAAEVLEKYFPERIGQTLLFHCIEHYPGKIGTPRSNADWDYYEKFDSVAFGLTIPRRVTTHCGPLATFDVVMARDASLPKGQFRIIEATKPPPMETRPMLGRPEWKPSTREQVEALIGRAYTEPPGRNNQKWVRQSDASTSGGRPPRPASRIGV